MKLLKGVCMSTTEACGGSEYTIDINPVAISKVMRNAVDYYADPLVYDETCTYVKVIGNDRNTYRIDMPYAELMAKLADA